MQKAGSTLRCSRTVPQSSTDRALLRLTSEFGRDPVYSERYGRQRTYTAEALSIAEAGQDYKKKVKNLKRKKAPSSTADAAELGALIIGIGTGKNKS